MGLSLAHGNMWNSLVTCPHHMTLTVDRDQKTPPLALSSAVCYDSSHSFRFSDVSHLNLTFTCCFGVVKKHSFSLLVL